jgi:dipeptidyl aminopeptidase/acylaminoacyl peptidase
MTHRDIRGTATYAEIEALCTAIRRPGSGLVSDALEPDVAPDGARVVFSGVVAAALEGGLPTRVCAVDLATGDLRILTAGPNVDRSPKHAPDGSRIAFLSDRRRRGDYQLHFLDPSTGEVSAAPTVDGWVEYLHWSPDARRILLGVAGHGADVSSGQGATTSALGQDGSPSWMPDVESGDDEAAWRRLWVYEIADGTVRPVGPPEANVWEGVWCGDDAAVAVVSPGPREGLWYSARLEVLELAGGRREILVPETQLGWPAASPSGRRIAVVEAFCSDRLIVAGDLRLVDPTGGGARTIDTRGVDVTFATWRTEDRLLFAGHRGLESVVAIYDAAADRTTEVWASRELTTGGRYISLAPIGDAGDGVLLGENFTRAPEVAVLEGGAYRTVRSFDLGYADAAAAIAAVETVTWNAPDGLEIEGWLLRPEGEGPHPVVLYVHGGPVLLSRPTFLGRLPLPLALVQHGYAVFSPNPRGSSGRGQAFARLVQGDLGGADSRDLLAGLDALVERGIADPTRIGVTGTSYGGFQSSWLVTQDRRFAASVPTSPHTNQVTAQLLSNISEFMPLFLGGRFDDPTGVYPERSPVMHARNVVTPTLSVAGALDECTPAEEAAQFHRALREHGVPTELVVYPEEGHGVRSYPALIDYVARAVDWFERHMPATQERT